MNKSKKFGMAALICAMMLVSTGSFASASGTTKIQTYREQIKEKSIELRSAFNMTNNTKEQLVRVIALVGVNAIGLFLLWKLRGFKSIKPLIIGFLIGFDAAVIPALILNMQRQPQNETNSTLR